MPAFRTATTHADAKRSRGNWTISGQLVKQTSPKMKKTIKQKTTFLDLPGEIRNKMYGYYLTDSFRVEFAAKRAPPPRKQIKFTFVSPVAPRKQIASSTTKDAKILVIQHTRPQIHRIRTKVPPSADTKWATSFSSLFLTCKTIYKETCPLHYAITTFRFEKSKSLRNFLSTVPAPNLYSLQKLELRHGSYGEPKLANDIQWKKISDKNWFLLCRDAARSLPNLKTLKIELYVVETPLMFELYEPWVQPLLEFRHVNGIPTEPIRRAPSKSQKYLLQSQRSRGATSKEEGHTGSVAENHEVPEQKSDSDSTLVAGLSSQCHQMPLTSVEIMIWTWADSKHAQEAIDPEITKAYLHLKRLFQDAIKCMILGWDQRDAMCQYIRTYRKKYMQWVEELNLNEPTDILRDREW